MNLITCWSCGIDNYSTWTGDEYVGLADCPVCTKKITKTGENLL